MNPRTKSEYETCQSTPWTCKSSSTFYESEKLKMLLLLSTSVKHEEGRGHAREEEAGNVPPSASLTVCLPVSAPLPPSELITLDGRGREEM